MTNCLDRNTGAGRQLSNKLTTVLTPSGAVAGRNTSIQLHLSSIEDKEKPPVDVAIGTNSRGSHASVSDMFNAYCAVKPLLGLALGHVAADYAMSLDTSIGELLGRGCPRWVSAEVRLRDILSHQAGLEHPKLSLWLMCGPDDRSDYLSQLPDQMPRSVYSDLGAGLLVEQVISTLTGCAPAEFIFHRILAPLNLTSDIVVRARDLGSEEIAKRVMVAMTQGRFGPVPMLAQGDRWRLGRLHPAAGALVSARGLGRLYRAIGIVVRTGRELDGMPPPSVLEDLLRPCPDGTVVSDGAYAGMFMTGAAPFGVEEFKGRILGHTSGVMNVLGCFDDRSGMVLAGVFNGVAFERDDLIASRSTAVDTAVDWYMATFGGLDD